MKLFNAITNVVFPEVCFACNDFLGDNQNTICVDCRHELPVINAHFETDDLITKVLYGRVDLVNATAMFRFEKKGKVQQLIHNLKYRGYQQIGTHLGSWLGNELASVDAYNDIDAVIPVPLHKAKFRKRGYNQVTNFGVEIANALNADFIDDVLIKVKNTESKVFKNRFSRWSTDDAVFAIQNTEKIKNKHILLVDDLITTGATIEACANQLLKAENVKISLATIAIA